MLRVFQTKTVQAAVLQVAASQESFPHLGHLFQACRLIESGRGDRTPLNITELNVLAESLGLKNAM